MGEGGGGREVWGEEETGGMGVGGQRRQGLGGEKETGCVWGGGRARLTVTT